MITFNARRQASAMLLWAMASMAGADCSQWPPGMTFVGLTEQGWQTYGVLPESDSPQAIELNTEARTPVMASHRQAVAYLDEAGEVRVDALDSQQSEVWVEPSSQAAYAQPEWNTEHDRLYLVQLKDGESVDTDILEFDPQSRSLSPIITQRSAQFEPHLAGDWLYYSNVHCVLGCGKIIQEIWRYHLPSGTAEQVTLQNVISRQPAVDEAHSWLYFSSNAAGHFHIYRQSLQPDAAATAEPLTSGAVSDLAPAPVGDRLYFIRRQADGSALVCRDAAGELHTLQTPPEVRDVRALEVRN